MVARSRARCTAMRRATACSGGLAEWPPRAVEKPDPADAYKPHSAPTHAALPLGDHVTRAGKRTTLDFVGTPQGVAAVPAAGDCGIDEHERAFPVRKDARGALVWVFALATCAILRCTTR
jgi:hypothetical protein